MKWRIINVLLPLNVSVKKLFYLVQDFFGHPWMVSYMLNNELFSCFTDIILLGQVIIVRSTTLVSQESLLCGKYNLTNENNIFPLTYSDNRAMLNLFRILSTPVSKNRNEHFTIFSLQILFWCKHIHNFPPICIKSHEFDEWDKFISLI